VQKSGQLQSIGWQCVRFESIQFWRHFKARTWPRRSAFSDPKASQTTPPQATPPQAERKDCLSLSLSEDAGIGIAVDTSRETAPGEVFK